MFKVIHHVLSTLGAAKVYDLSLSTQFVLSEGYREFWTSYSQSEKFKEISECLQLSPGQSSEDAVRTISDAKKKISKVPAKPVLCSECPGWICYAEKVVGDTAIPFMSTVKSPQQLQGHLLKKVANRKLFVANEDSEVPDNLMHI